jgi:hypothetical protein
MQNKNGNKPMENEQNEKTPRASPHSGGSSQRNASLAYDVPSATCVTQQSEEDRIRSKIMGTPGVQYKTGRGDRQRAQEDNIGMQLLAQFDSEAEDDDDEEAELDMTSVEQIIDKKEENNGDWYKQMGPSSGYKDE